MCFTFTLRMCKVKWKVVDIHFLVALLELWFNKEFKRYQGKDPNIGCHGYLSLHRTIWTYIQLRDLDRMQNTWKETDVFAANRCSYNVLSSDTKKKKTCNGTIFWVNVIANKEAQWSLFEGNINFEISFWRATNGHSFWKTNQGTRTNFKWTW